MKEVEIENEHIQLVEDFLIQCDLVKFAKYIPIQEENQKVVDQAFEIVNTTKIIFEPETSEVEETAPAEKITTEITEPTTETIPEDMEVG